MKIEIIIQMYHSIPILKNMLIKAPINVDNDNKESFKASTQLALKLQEFSFFHRFLKYFHRNSFTKIAIITTVNVTMV